MSSKMASVFENNELRRYSRQLVLPEFNINGQKKLKQSSVLVVGAGGLGSPTLLYLVAAGVGTIGIMDSDTVDLSNLQRQVIYSVADVGEKKAFVAAKKLKSFNPFVKCISYDTFLTNDNALDIIKKYDLIIDGTDNFSARYLINDACVLLGKPFIYGSIYQFEGQVSVFNYKTKKTQKPPCYRCLYANPPPPNLVPNCSEGGVLGVLPGIIGSMQANEAIKVLAEIGEPLVGRLFIFDALTFTNQIIEYENDRNCALCGDVPTINELQDYNFFCKMNASEMDASKEVTVKTLKKKLDDGIDFQLIDVREPFEIELVSIGGELISFGVVENDLDSVISKIRVNKDVIFYCRDGKRSKAMISMLEKQYGLSNLYNLRGGIQEWILKIDPSLPYY